jgi:hypothetical protein
MERCDEEEERAKEEYEKHKCRNCEWATWHQIYIVSCLFPRCVKENPYFKGYKCKVFFNLDDKGR